MFHNSKRRLRRILTIFAAALVSHCLISMVITKFIYDSVFPRYDAPVTARIPVQVAPVPVSFPSGDYQLSGRLYDSSRDSLIVYVQGINSQTDEHAPVIDSLLSCADVFIFDPTGAGESEGDNAIGFSQTVLDLHAALDYIDGAYNYEDIFLFGHSRGGHAVCCVASQRQDVDAVVSVNAPNSAMDAVMVPTLNTVGPVGYANWPFLWLHQALIFGAETASLQADECLSQISVPVLIVQAEDDTTVPPEYSVYGHRETIPSSNVMFLLIQGGHTSVLFSEDNTQANEELFTAVYNFFEER